MSRDSFNGRLDFQKKKHTIHVWHIYLHVLDFYGINVDKYTVLPMDGMGLVSFGSTSTSRRWIA